MNNPFENVSLAVIVKQLESCDYQCQAGVLKNNAAFIELKSRAEQEQLALYNGIDGIEIIKFEQEDK